MDNYSQNLYKKMIGTTQKTKLSMLVSLVLAILFGFSCVCQAQQGEEDLNNIMSSLSSITHIEGEKRIIASFIERMKHYNIPGASIAIMKDGELLISKAYGVKTANNSDPVDRNTLFQAASITKSFSALAILKLVDQGKISLDDPVNLHLKGWKLADNDFTKDRAVTIRSLLNHTGGTNVHGFDGFAQGLVLPTTTAVLAGEGTSDPVVVFQKPYEKWDYSGGGYVILQKVIEDVTGLTFSNFMKAEIIEPLGMTNSTFQQPLDTLIYDNISVAHHVNGDVWENGWQNFAEAAAGGLWTTAEDLIQYYIEIQSIISGNEDGILKKSTIEEMLKPGLNNWGLGVEIRGTGDDIKFGHEGSNPGYFGEMMGFAEKGDAVVILTNGSSGSLVKEFLIAVSDYYNWDWSHQRKLQIQTYNESKLYRYTGRYAWTENEAWQVDMTQKDGKLIFTPPNYPADILTPLSPSNFIDLRTGLEVKFTIDENEKVKAMTWKGGNNFNKIEN